MHELKNKKIVIAGGTGFIGRALVAYFGETNEVKVLSRQTEAGTGCWDGRTMTGWEKWIDGSDILINLAGKNINCRPTPANRNALLESRVAATRVLGEAVRAARKPPALWINASGIAPYAEDSLQPQDEYSVVQGNSFHAEVVRQWEKAFFGSDTPGVRKLALRLAVVLGAGGVLEPYLNLVKFGLGGTQGSGRQMCSWVHITDVCRIIEFAGETGIHGLVNAVAPGVVDNRHFMRALRQHCGAKIALPAYSWMIRLGAKLVGTDSDLALTGHWVRSARLKENGFVFRFGELDMALADIIHQLPAQRYRLF